MSTLESLLEALTQAPDTVEFDQVIAVIAENYHYTPVAFTNGEASNEAGTNEGSCKLFAFGMLNNLTEAQMLACFGKYYRDDVLKHPEGSDHANIRNFMITGWNGVSFQGEALAVRGCGCC